MSNVFLYHYLSSTSAPKTYEVANGSAWGIHLGRLFWTDGLQPIRAHEQQEQYMRFQESSAPDWKKIAAGLYGEPTLVLDEDRPIVIHALDNTFREVYRKREPRTIQKVANLVRSIPAGPLVVTASQTAGDFPYYDVINVANFKAALEMYKRDPTREEMEALLDKHEDSVLMPLEKVLETIRRPTPVPRYCE